MLCSGGDGPEAERGPEPLWRMCVALGEAARRRGALDAAVGLGRHALRHAAQTSALGRARAHAFLAAVEHERGSAAEAATHRHHAVEELRHAGDRRGTAELLIALVESNGVERATAQDWVRQAEALADELGWPEGVSRSRAAAAKVP
jgi:hypothetical protein